MGLFHRITNVFHKKDPETKSPEPAPQRSPFPSNGLNSNNITGNPDNFFCQTCGKKFDSELELEYHLKTQPEVHDAYDDKWDMMVRSETEEEKMLREQQDAIRKLDAMFTPTTKNCCVCGKKEFPPFEGRDGNYYCRDHILPENRKT